MPRLRQTVLPTTLTALVVGACFHESELLNSERIEARFGSYGVEVLRQNRGLGATFRNAGRTIRKRSLCTGSAGLEPDNSIVSVMRLAPNRPLAIHVYRLYLERDHESGPYANIMEVHHPDYLSLKE